MLVILDRDGVINRDLPTGVLQFAEFELLPGVVASIAALCHAGHGVVIATNQSAIGKGWTTRAIVDEAHAYLAREVEAAGGKISRIYVADEAPDAQSFRRKPEPGMLIEALKEFHSNAQDAVFVGDAVTDLEAAYRAAVPSILVRTGKGAITEKEKPPHLQPIAIVDDLPAAVHWIIEKA